MSSHNPNHVCSIKNEVETVPPAHSSVPIPATMVKIEQVSCKDTFISKTIELYL